MVGYLFSPVWLRKHNTPYIVKQNFLYGKVSFKVLTSSFAAPHAVWILLSLGITSAITTKITWLEVRTLI